MERKIKLQTKAISIPAGSPAGTTLEREIDLDESYNRVTGIVLYDAGTTPYRIGLEDNNGSVLLDLTNSTHFQSTASTSKGERMTVVDFKPTKGMKVKIRPITTAVNGIDLDLVFQLKRDC